MKNKTNHSHLHGYYPFWIFKTLKHINMIMISFYLMHWCKIQTYDLIVELLCYYTYYSRLCEYIINYFLMVWNMNMWKNCQCLGLHQNNFFFSNEEKENCTFSKPNSSLSNWVGLSWLYVTFSIEEKCLHIHPKWTLPQIWSRVLFKLDKI